MKFSKEADKRIEALAEAVNNEYSTLEAAIADYNAGLEALKEKLTGAVENYNAVLLALREGVESERDQFQSEFDERSEKWQEGEKGEAAKSFIDALDEVATGEAMEDFSPELPEEIDGPSDN